MQGILLFAPALAARSHSPCSRGKELMNWLQRGGKLDSACDWGDGRGGKGRSRCGKSPAVTGKNDARDRLRLSLLECKELRPSSIHRLAMVVCMWFSGPSAFCLRISMRTAARLRFPCSSVCTSEMRTTDVTAAVRTEQQCLLLQEFSFFDPKLVFRSAHRIFSSTTKSRRVVADAGRATS